LPGLGKLYNRLARGKHPVLQNKPIGGFSCAGRKPTGAQLANLDCKYCFLPEQRETGLYGGRLPCRDWAD